ncbi:ParB/RepB/Spo0J family partition protein [Photobacterium sp. R1]
MAKKPGLQALRKTLAENEPQGTVASILNQQSKAVIRVHHSELYSVVQVRKQFNEEALDELGASMVDDGQHHPITVSPRDKKGYCIQKGERRWRAAAKRDLYVDIVVREPSSNEAREVIGQLSENIHNAPLTPLEIAETLFCLQTVYKLDRTELQKAVNKSSSYISQHLGLMKLPECVRQLSERAVVNDADTLNTLRKAYEVNAAKTTDFIQSISKDGISRGDARSFHVSLKAPVKSKPLNQDPMVENKNEPVTENEPRTLEQEQHQAPTPQRKEVESRSSTEMIQNKQNQYEAIETHNEHEPGEIEKKLELRIEVAIDGDIGFLLADRIDPNGETVSVQMTYGVLELPIEDCKVMGVKYAGS